MRLVAGTILTVLLVSGVANASSPSASPRQPATSPVVTAVLLKAKEWFHRFETGDIDRSQLDALVNSQLTEAMVQKEGAVLRAFGSVTSWSFVRSYPVGDVTGYDFLLEFKSGRIVEMIAFDPDGKIAGIDFETFVKENS